MPPSPPDCARIASTSRRGAGVDAALRPPLARGACGQQGRRQPLVRRRIGRGEDRQAMPPAAARRAVIIGLPRPRLTSPILCKRAARPHRLRAIRSAARRCGSAAALLGTHALCRRSRLALSGGMFFAKAQHQCRHRALRVRTRSGRRSRRKGLWTYPRPCPARPDRTFSPHRLLAAGRRRAQTADQILARLQVRRPGGAVRGRDRQGLLQGRGARRHHRHRRAARSSRSTASPPAPTTWASATSTR